MTKQEMLKALYDILGESMSAQLFPENMEQFLRFTRLLEAVIKALPDDKSAEQEVEKAG